MEKEKIEEIVVIAAKGIFASIPYFGSTLTSIWSDIQANFV